MRWRPSPNHDERPPGAAVDLVVLHYTGMVSARAALDRLRDPAARVSAHYLIDEDGTIVAMVPEIRRAWHAGVSWWRGRAGLNDVSLGIELVNPGHEWGYRPFPEPQVKALIDLALDVRRRWGVLADGIVAHSDVAPTRKEDPGELLDWERLARAGLGRWPATAPPREPDTAEAARALSAIGYPLEPQGVPFAAALRAFQRRYRPAAVDGVLDAETMGRLVAVAALPIEGPRST